MEVEKIGLREMREREQVPLLFVWDKLLTRMWEKLPVFGL